MNDTAMTPDLTQAQNLRDTLEDRLARLRREIEAEEDSLAAQMLTGQRPEGWYLDVLLGERRELLRDLRLLSLGLVHAEAGGR